MSVTPLVVRGYSLGAAATSYGFRPYVYNGTQPLAKEPKKTRPGSPPCETEGCETPAHAVGLCTVHYHKYRYALKKDPSLKKPRPTGFQPDKCGTNAGRARHLYYGLEPCRPCLIAHNEYRAEQKRAQKERKEARNAADGARRG